MSKEIVVIGGGPAGIEAAREAAKLGLAVILISAGPVGGRAGWHSLLPSKVWLAAADEEVKPGAEDILARLAQIKQDWNEQARAELDALGVMVLPGTAVFDGPNSIQVHDNEGKVVAAFAGVPLVVASGSVPVFPPGLKPDGKRVIAPRLLSKLAALPSSMLVIGAGATGCEAAYLFNALGAEVTWIVDQFGILPQFSGAAGEALGAALDEQGVRIVSGQMVQTVARDEDKVTAVLEDGSRHEAEMAFVAVGRRRDWDGLNLAAAGIEVDGGAAVDAYGRSVDPLVYLVGDVDGTVMTANKAQAQGRTAARMIAGVDAAPFSLQTLIQPVYTEPQVAQVGDMTGGSDVIRARVPFSESLKSHLMAEGAGFLELAYNKKDGRVLGAVAVGPHAADALSPIAVAIKLGGRVGDLADIYAAYPSVSELAFIAARK